MKAGATLVDKSTVTGPPLVPVPLLAVVAKAGQLQGAGRGGWTGRVILPRQKGCLAERRQPQMPPSQAWHVLSAGEPAWGSGPTLAAQQACRRPLQRDSSQADALWSQSPQREQGP